LALAGLFVGWERRARTPMLQLEFFRDRTFASANAVSFFMYAALFGTLFLMAQFFQIALGHSPLGAGIRLLPWTGAPMIVAPIAGALSERYGNRPFMAAGLALQTIGLAWVALIAAPGIGYLQLGLALMVAGVGISLCFPTVANAVMGSVPLTEAGVASGTNSMLRELGGVLGIAVLASVFARQGVYHSPRIFIDGFTQALWVGVGFSALGSVAALLGPRRKRTVETVAAPAVLATHEPLGETT
jgi:MFS family permease